MEIKSVFSDLPAGRNLCRGLVLLLLSLLCLNVVVISVMGGYDIRFGFLHLTAHGAFKPMLMMNGCFLAALMICGAAGKARNEAPTFAGGRLRPRILFRSALAGAVLLLVLAIYLPATRIDIHHNEWTQKHVSAEKPTLLSNWQFFTHGDPTGFYRPLGFVSLWLDYRFFGSAAAGYYAQSIALHFANALLAAWLALSLGFGRRYSFWAGLLFAAAAVNFEAVIWPAARFDLLATMFTLLALIFAIRYFRDARMWAWTLPAALLCYVFGILSKESSYCFPLILAFLLGTHSLWAIPKPARSKLVLCLLLVASATVLMLHIRIAIYGNLGGYPTAAGVPSYHFRINGRTFISLVRAVPIPILGINTGSMAREWARFVPAVLAGLVLLAAFLCRGCFRRREYALTAMVVLSLAPVLNIVGWIGSWMQHSRYLYMPAVFMMLLMASAMGKVRWSTGILAAFLLVNALGAASNIRVYRDMLGRAAKIADAVRADWMRQPSARTICLLDLPEHTEGVFYFGSEVAERIQAEIPGATIVRPEAYDPAGSDPAAKLIYRWSRSGRTLHLVERPQ